MVIYQPQHIPFPITFHFPNLASADKFALLIAYNIIFKSDESVRSGTLRNHAFTQNDGGYGYDNGPYNNGPYQGGAAPYGNPYNNGYNDPYNKPYQPGPGYNNYGQGGGYGYNNNNNNGADDCCACLAGACCACCLLEMCLR